MYSVKDSLFALDGGQQLSFREAVRLNAWPRVTPDGAAQHSLRAWCDRFHESGRVLHAMAGDTDKAWPNFQRDVVVSQVRERLRNPFLVGQRETELCGPASLVMLLAWRRPADYVRAARELLRDGKFSTIGGRVFTAESDLRHRHKARSVDEVDWLFLATMRDSENISDDIDDGLGVEGITWPFEIEAWIRNVLGLDAKEFDCYRDGEMNALDHGLAAMAAGGVAILLIDSNLLEWVAQASEEWAWFRSRPYFEGSRADDWTTEFLHSADDDLPPDHWAVLQRVEVSEVTGELFVYLWCWEQQFQVKATREAFGEYLYSVLTGRP